MNDRDLLEAAAMAAGLTGDWWEKYPGQWWLCGRGAGEKPPTVWSPLEDDGNALRLAADLQMDVFVRAEWVEAVAPMGAPQKVRYGLDGRQQAVRRAITCAAAAMPPRRVTVTSAGSPATAPAAARRDALDEW
jgi:hypothetical protein